mmetsp:Transcript_17902/g.27684  ORF Transcript_17902/g.27684 Transcript_17902/m.27684 type:complete len:153 (+) Transcript_17902:3-461(+)
MDSNSESRKIHPDNSPEPPTSNSKLVPQHQGSNSFEAEGGDLKSEKDEVKKATPEEDKQKEKLEKEKLELQTRAKTSEILWGYVKTYKVLLFWGFIFNILGMVGEFASPLFIGLVIDEIVAQDQDQVVYLIVLWMIINTAGAIFAGIQRFIF